MCIASNGSSKPIRPLSWPMGSQLLKFGQLHVECTCTTGLSLWLIHNISICTEWTYDAWSLWDNASTFLGTNHSCVHSYKLRKTAIHSILHLPPVCSSRIADTLHSPSCRYSSCTSGSCIHLLLSYISAPLCIWHLRTLNMYCIVLSLELHSPLFTMQS